MCSLAQFVPPESRSTRGFSDTKVAEARTFGIWGCQGCDFEVCLRLRCSRIVILKLMISCDLSRLLNCPRATRDAVSKYPLLFLKNWCKNIGRASSCTTHTGYVTLDAKSIVALYVIVDWWILNSSQIYPISEASFNIIIISFLWTPSACIAIFLNMQPVQFFLGWKSP